MRTRRPALAALGICALAASASAVAAPAAHAVEPSTGRLEILLDASGSMADPAGDGHSKIHDARQALTTMIDGMQDSTQVGMRVYGATAPPGKDTRQACSDSQQVVPVQPLDRAALKSAIKRYSPKGQTPTAYALQQAAKDLGTTGQRSIVLVSDGESTCSPDPCDTAKELAAKGIDLRVDVVGFKVGDKARKQLSCIASATGGKYFPASDTTGLTEALETTRTRAAQPFSISGKKITGTPTSSGAPEIGAGRWTDTVPADGETAKYYHLKHTMPNSDFLIGITSRPKVEDSQLQLSVSTADGTSCGSVWPMSIGFGKSSRDLLTGSLSTAATYSWKAACHTDDLILKIEQTNWGDDASGTPMQLSVIETPEPTNSSILKGDDRSTSATWQPMPIQDPQGTTVGGTGLSTATRLTPGTSTNLELIPGELKFFKVSATWGQQVQAVATAEQNPAYKTSSIREFNVDILSPVGGMASATSVDGMPKGDLGTLSHQRLLDDDGARVAATTVPIRLRNRTSYSDRAVGSSVAGDYYVVVGLSTTTSGTDTVRTPLKVDLQVATTGQPGQDAPRFAAGEGVRPSTGAAATDTSTSLVPPTSGSTGSRSSTEPSSSNSGGSTSTAPASSAGSVRAVGTEAGGVPVAGGSGHTNWPLVGGLSGGAALLAIVGAGAAMALRRR